MSDPLGFSIGYRNPGHWDVYAHTGADHRNERAFPIRGEVGDVRVYDERTDPSRPFPHDTQAFRSVQTAVAWIADELMRELRP